jgi:hypothetical protein
VSLLDPRWGEVRLGRDFVPSYNAYDDFDAFGRLGVASGDKFQNKLGTSIDTLMRADNLVAYYTPPALGGFSAALAVAARRRRERQEVFRRSHRLCGAVVPALGGRGQTTVTPDASGEDKYKFYALGGAYDFHVAELMGYWTRSKFADQKLDVFNVGANIPLGRGKVRVSYARRRRIGPHRCWHRHERRRRPPVRDRLRVRPLEAHRAVRNGRARQQQGQRRLRHRLSADRAARPEFDRLRGRHPAQLLRRNARSPQGGCYRSGSRRTGLPASTVTTSPGARPGSDVRS